MGNAFKGRKPRITLDGQLVTYWDREAARLDALAHNATFSWMARGYARKAERARALADKSRAKEIARGNLDPTPAETAGRDAAVELRMMKRKASSDPSNCPLIGRWRIFESDLWDADYLDMVDPAAMTIGADGNGEFGFGVVSCGMDIGYAGDIISFTFRGSDEGDEVSGAGFAELGEDGNLEIELSFHHGDEAVLKARRP